MAFHFDGNFSGRKIETKTEKRLISYKRWINEEIKSEAALNDQQRKNHIKYVMKKDGWEKNKSKNSYKKNS